MECHTSNTPWDAYAFTSDNTKVFTNAQFTSAMDPNDWEIPAGVSVIDITGGSMAPF